MFDKIAEVSLLFDFYGQLLTKKQQEVMRLYHEENYSLSEIADEFSISRQGVHDTLKKGEKALKDYEEKLGLLYKLESTAKAISEIEASIDLVMDQHKSDSDLCRKLKQMKQIIENLNQ